MSINLTKLRNFLVKIAIKLGLYESRYKSYAVYVVRYTKAFLKLRRKVLCLDLGCGDGFFTQLLAKYCDYVVGIDINKHSSWYFRENTNSSFIVSDARKIPLRSSSTDIVLIISLLEHVPKWEAILLEVYRVLRGGGIAIIQIPNLYTIIEPHTHLPLVSLMPTPIKDLLVYRTVYDKIQWNCNLKQALKILKNVGFENLGITFHSHTTIPGPQAFFIIALKIFNHAKKAI